MTSVQIYLCAALVAICIALIYYIYYEKSKRRLTVGNVSSQIFSVVQLPMLVLNEKNEITIINQAAADYLGTPREETIGAPITSFFALPEYANLMTENEQNFDALCTTSGAQCRLQVSALLGDHDKPIGSIIMVTDLTDVVALISELEMYRNHLQEKLDEKTTELESVMLQAISAVANTIDAKSEFTKGHSVQVARYAQSIAEAMGLSAQQIRDLGYMALLHDIGRISIPDSILSNPGKLSPEEYEVVKQHTTIGAEILEDITMVKGVSFAARYHHERFDGSGYPDGLAGDEIPLEARIIAVADAFDAMNNNRSYRGKLTREEILQELDNGRGTQFDPKVVDTFEILLLNDGFESEQPREETSIFSASNQLLMNIIERQNEQTLLEANLDFLTKTLNRRACESEVIKAMSTEPGVLMIIDLDHFKQVNDTLGHLEGDQVLRIATECMRRFTPADAIIGRQGGDEFVIFLRGVEEREKALQIAKTIRKEFIKEVSGTEVLRNCSLSIGISLPTSTSSSFNDAFAQADKALYFVKQTGRNNEFMFEENMKSSGSTISRNVSQVVAILQNTEAYTGAFAVEVQELRKIYEYVSSFARRYHYGMEILLFTVESRADDEEILERSEGAIVQLRTAIQQSLRSVDISVRYGSSQMVVILLDTNPVGVKTVTDRIITNFQRLYAQDDVNVYCDSQSLIDSSLFEKK